MRATHQTEESPAVLKVVCPKCDAPPGVHCRSTKISGDRKYFKYPHQQRYALAEHQVTRERKRLPREGDFHDYRDPFIRMDLGGAGPGEAARASEAREQLWSRDYEPLDFAGARRDPVFGTVDWGAGERAARKERAAAARQRRKEGVR